MSKDKERQRKELLVKARLEERELERRKAIEQRKREQANKKYLTVNCTVLIVYHQF